jgi:hypothetical protein
MPTPKRPPRGARSRFHPCSEPGAVLVAPVTGERFGRFGRLGELEPRGTEPIQGKAERTVVR